MIAPNYLGGNNTIGGIQYAGDYLFNSEATLSFAGAVSSTHLSGSLANQMLKDINGGWFYTFNDPMNMMLDAMREIAFRASLKVGRDNSTVPVQTLAFTGRRTYSVYRADWVYLILAVTMSIAGLTSILATFHGWWRLGRDVSMNPLEVCKAFSAPLLEDAGSNVSFQTFPEHATDFEVRYGFIPDGPTTVKPDTVASVTPRLVVDEVTRIHAPREGQIFQ